MTSLALIGFIMVLEWTLAVGGGPSDSCTVVPKTNVSAPNVASPKYVFTPEDCCHFCAETAGCVAATYADYLCSPKASNETTADAVSSTILVSRTTPSPAPPPTEAPTTKAPATTTTHPTIAPVTATPSPATTTPQPSTPQPSTAQPSTAQPTPQPTERNYSHLVLVTACRYSSLCSRQTDLTCQTFADFSDVCYNDQVGTASYMYAVQTSGGVTTIDRWRFNSVDCSGTSTLDHPAQKTCVGYLGGYSSLDVVKLPEPAVRNCPYIERTLVQALYPSNNTLYVNGGCDLADQVHAQYGLSISVVSDGSIVWWRAFSSADCSGRPTASFADALGLPYTAASDDGTVTWTCVHLSPPETPPPAATLVATRTVCDNATCQYSTGAGCNSDAAASGSCMASGSLSFQYVCHQDNVVVRQFNSSDCSGDSNDVLQPTGQCILKDDDLYHQWDCIDIGEAKDLSVTRTSCVYFPPADGCHAESFSTGACTSYGSGEWMVVDCSSSMAWWRLYNSSGPCEGIPIQSGTAPLGTWHWNSNSLRYVEWNCTSS